MVITSIIFFFVERITSIMLNYHFLEEKRTRLFIEPLYNFQSFHFLELIFEKCYVHNIFTIFLQQILNDRLLRAVTSGQESNFSDGFKLKTCNNLQFRIFP